MSCGIFTDNSNSLPYQEEGYVILQYVHQGFKLPFDKEE